MFTPEDREIYSYHNGVSEVFADPLALKRKLVQAARGDLAGLISRASPPEETLQAEDPDRTLDRMNAETELLAVVRAAFQLSEVNPATGEGCTDSMVWRVWDHFGDYVSGEKKRGV